MLHLSPYLIKQGNKVRFYISLPLLLILSVFPPPPSYLNVENQLQIQYMQFVVNVGCMLEMYVEFDSLFQGYSFYFYFFLFGCGLGFLIFYYFPEYLNLHACKSEMQFALMYLPHSVSPK